MDQNKLAFELGNLLLFNLELASTLDERNAKIAELEKKLGELAPANADSGPGVDPAKTPGTSKP